MSSISHQTNLVIPAKAGIHGLSCRPAPRSSGKTNGSAMDSRLRGNDKIGGGLNWQVGPPTLDSPPNPASCAPVRRGDGLSGQPSETVGERNLPFLISSLDGDRDFRCRVFRPPSPPAPTQRSRATGMKLPHGLKSRIALSGGSYFRVGFVRFAGKARIRSNA